MSAGERGRRGGPAAGAPVSAGQRSGPVITGIGALTPLGLDAQSTWEGLTAGRSGIRALSRFEDGRSGDGRPSAIAGEIHGFDPEALLGRRRAHRTARFSQLAVAAAREALADAALAVEQIGERVGVLINSAVAGAPEAEAGIRALAAGGPREVSPYHVASTIPNMPACEVAIDLGVHGPVSCSALACASGSYALLEAARLIGCGEADVVIAGGADAGISAAMFASLQNMGAMSQRSSEPERASRPFDADRDGFVYGEGAVVFVLESEAHARARGARHYGTLAGGALTCDAFHMSAPEPSGEHAARAIRLALQRSDTAPAELDYICAHGTSTRANDITETRAIRLALGPAADDVPLSSPKSMVGHLIGAAGALSALVCLLAMRDGILPPTINLDTPDPECDLDYVPLRSRGARVRTAALNAFGFGGQNCVLVLRAP